MRTSDDRSETRSGGRTTRHSFSFGAHYDPRNVGFASLVAHNDEVLPSGTGYPDHPHADTEIVSWVVEGALRHTSTVGSRELGAGSVQRLSAGSGVVHSEVAAGAGTTRFLQAWVRPDEPGAEPSYDAAPVSLDAGWTCLVGREGRLGLGASGVALHAAALGEGDRLALPDAARLHLFVAAPAEVASHGVMLGERRLLDGDAARLVDEGERVVTAVGAAQLLVWAFG